MFLFFVLSIYVPAASPTASPIIFSTDFFSFGNTLPSFSWKKSLLWLCRLRCLTFSSLLWVWERERERERDWGRGIKKKFICGVNVGMQYNSLLQTPIYILGYGQSFFFAPSCVFFFFLCVHWWLRGWQNVCVIVLVFVWVWVWVWWLSIFRHPIHSKFLYIKISRKWVVWYRPGPQQTTSFCT